MSVLQFLSSLGAGASCAQLAGAGVCGTSHRAGLAGGFRFQLVKPALRLDRTEHFKASCLCQRPVLLLGLTSSRLEVEASASAIRKAAAN